jgi:hypothetical protein
VRDAAEIVSWNATVSRERFAGIRLECDRKHLIGKTIQAPFSQQIGDMNKARANASILQAFVEASFRFVQFRTDSKFCG